ncbi:MAG: DUF167 domain-containing protein [Desulfuromonadaceae bacterium]|nr:DUF167 domain-containing protein [Desulfuromonas sp.]MDY0185981.1 DUF167 domain-containing protein [Desulfuromonadaceae bacterium]
MDADSLRCCVRQGDADTLISVLVQPRASKNALCGLQGEELKVRLTSPPVDGAANKMCCAYFARLLGCAKSNVSIERGHSSRHKQIRVAACTAAEVRKVLHNQLT